MTKKQLMLLDRIAYAGFILYILVFTAMLFTDTLDAEGVTTKTIYYSETVKFSEMTIYSDCKTSGAFTAEVRAPLKSVTLFRVSSWDSQSTRPSLLIGLTEYEKDGLQKIVSIKQKYNVALENGSEDCWQKIVSLLGNQN